MASVSNGFFDEAASFVKRHKTLCALTLGLAVVVYALGNLAGRVVSWICECCGTTKKVDTVAHETFFSFNSRENKPTDETRTSREESPLLPHTSTSDQESPSVLSTESRIQQLQAEYNALKAKSLSELTESIYVIPERRVCNFGGMESEQTKEKAKKAIFVTNEEIVKVHPIKFLPNSPFVVKDTPRLKRWLEKTEDETVWSSILATTKKQAYAIAVTEGGKHVILQQAVKSCVPTCMAMLILDRGEKPNYEAIKTTNLANTERAIGWAKEAQLECQVNKIPQENVIEVLSKYLAEKGPGMLSIDHPTIDGHVIILDEISIEKNEAVIRDSFHGWMVTMDLGALKAWLRPGEDFVQIL